MGISFMDEINDIQENYLSGWIKLYRSIEKHWIWEDPEKLKAWLTILLHVNHAEKKINIGNNIFICKRGESLKSLESWAKILGKKWNKSKIRRFLILLKNDHMIDLKTERKTTRITVCNYDSYQISRNDDETIVKRKRNDDETIVKPNKNDKKEKNDKEKELELIFDSFRKNFPGTKRGLETELDNFKKKHKDWAQVCRTLPGILDKQIRSRAIKEGRGEFVPQWKNLPTWINNRCWEEEITEEKKKTGEPLYQSLENYEYNKP